MTSCIGLELLLIGARLCLGQEAPTMVNNYATECYIFRPSRQDTAETLRQIAIQNARCRAARTR